MSRRDEILDALIEILLTKGIQTDFSISQLARKVDIGKSTIYEYFDTKDEILSQALFRLFEDSMNHVLKRTIDETKPFEALLKDEMKFVLKLAEDSRSIFEFITPDFQPNLPQEIKGDFAERGKKTARHYEQIFRSILAKGVAEGVLKPTNVNIQGTLFAALVSGSIHRFANVNVERSETVDLDEYVDAFYDLAVKLFN